MDISHYIAKSTRDRALLARTESLTEPPSAPGPARQRDSRHRCRASTGGGRPPPRPPRVVPVQGGSFPRRQLLPKRAVVQRQRMPIVHNTVLQCADGQAGGQCGVVALIPPLFALVYLNCDIN